MHLWYVIDCGGVVIEGKGDRRGGIPVMREECVERRHTFLWELPNFRCKSDPVYHSSSTTPPPSPQQIVQTLLKKKGGHFRGLAEKAAGDMGMVLEAFERGAAGLENGGHGQEMMAISK